MYDFNTLEIIKTNKYFLVTYNINSRNCQSYVCFWNLTDNKYILLAYKMFLPYFESIKYVGMSKICGCKTDTNASIVH